MWICPTFQRPERLAELALSWEEHQPATPLAVRIWDQDPRREDYFKIGWPATWELYVSNAKGAGEAINEYFRLHPNEATYGFIGDDIVLRTTGGLEILEAAAEPWFVAYPNDLFQRYRMCTHFCVGGELAKVMNGIVPPMFKHNYMDVGLWNVADQMRLIRYCPQVIFQHKHFLTKEYGIEKDETYKLVYPTEDSIPGGAYEMEGKKALQLFEKIYFPKVMDKLFRKIHDRYEQWDKWEEEDVTLHSCTG